MSKREELVEAAKELLWERGYEGMSPRVVQDASGAGQGSFYHHFRGKLFLASQALWEVCSEMRGEFDKHAAQSQDAAQHSRGLDCALEYLRSPRNALRGCRLGRLASERSIELAEIREPVAAYFSHVEGELERGLEEARQQGELDSSLDPGKVACTLIATVQGGYLLARIHGDPTYLEKAVRGAESLLRMAAPSPSRPSASRPSSPSA